MKRMSKIKGIWMLALLVFLGGSMTYAGGGDLVAKFQKKADKIAKAVLESDYDTMLKMYARGAYSMPSYTPMMKGTEAMAKHMEESKKSGMKMKSFSLKVVDVFGSGDLYVEIGTYSLVIEIPGMPKPMPDKGKYITIWQKQSDGSWKIKADTWNTDNDPMKMMKKMQ